MHAHPPSTKQKFRHVWSNLHFLILNLTFFIDLHVDTMKASRMLMDNDEVNIVDKDCTVGLNIFVLFLIEMRYILFG